MPGPLPWRNELFEPLTMKPPATPDGYRRMRAGIAAAVTEQNMLESTRRLAVEAGIWGSPEGGARLAAYEKLMGRPVVRRRRDGGSLQHRFRVEVSLGGPLRSHGSNVDHFVRS